MPKKGENIYKRKDNRWEARFIKDYRPDGTPKYGYCYGKTYREAKEKVAQARVLWSTGSASATPSWKKLFCYYCDEWLTMNRSRVKESTFAKYSNTLEKHIKPQFGNCTVQSLSSVMIEQFSHDLLYKERLAPKTVKDILIILHSILQYTRRQISEPLPVIEIIYPRIPKNEMRVLTVEEQKRFVDYLLEDMDGYKFGILLSLLTGMRIGEVCALRWENVDLDNQTIEVKSTMQRVRNFDDANKTKTKISITNPKSDNSYRVIPMTEYTAKLCTANRCDNPAAFVLTGSPDKFIEPRALQYNLKTYAEACDLEDIHFHTLRHTFATRCVEVDFEIKSLSEILGHASPKITLERYVHSSMELKRDNMKKLNSLGF